MDKTIIHIEAQINPTESEEKVRKAIENLFGNVETHVESIYRVVKILSESKTLDTLTKFQNLLRRECIRAAARTVLFGGTRDKTLTFCLNKQVAYAGHISFANEESESPLGPIKVRIQCDNPREVINWLTSGA
jgi:predicted RNA binding protein with dsRBD fold (UPF0201 family)